MKPCSDFGEQQEKNVFRRKGDVISLVEFEVIRCCPLGHAQHSSWEKSGAQERFGLKILTQE